MKQVEIKFISDGFKAILQSDGTKALVASAAEKIQASANSGVEGDGFTAKTWMGGYGGGRWIASVTSADRAAAVAESENKALSKAVHP
ncbi:MAG: hypothetical protein IJV68_05160 [Clostridia bacterium]|nr:hypothetical protein [Clostridia bacterium]